jgi:predicted secreted protein
MQKNSAKLAKILSAAALVALALAGCSSGPPTTSADVSELVVSELDDGKSVELGTTSVLRVHLKGQPSTGYAWRLETGDNELLKKVDESVDAAPNIGGVDTQVFKFVGVAPGNLTLRFVNRRSWEQPSASSPVYTVNVTVDGTFSGPEIVGSVAQPLDAQALAAAAPAFPARYNTCDARGCTPIKDQGGCGACWAFATNSAFENRILQMDGVTRDLSEQYLVSCGFGSCQGAGNAFEAYIDAVPAGEPGAGAVYEQDFPYVGADVACNAPHPHHEKAITKGDRVQITWTPEELVAHLKAGIYYEGPVLVGTCADGDFGAYTGGIFRAQNGCVNHMIVLTGWDDNNGDPYWLGRNSWGTGWGEAGQIKVAFGAGSLDYFGYGVYGSTGTNARYRSGATVQAKDYDSQRGTAVDANGNVTGFDLADFLCYFGVDMTGVTSLDLRLASNKTGGLFMVRADAYATYNELARYTMQSTGGTGTYTTVNVPITPKPGVHTLCLWGETGTGIFNIQNFTLKGTSTCTPQCAGKQCGSDGCGGTCGTCGAGQTCNASNQCVGTGSCTSLKLTPSAALASSTQSGLPANLAIDGNVSTRWSSLAADPQWLRIDYGSRRYFDRVILRWETAASANYDIQVSDDGTNFQTVRSNTAGAGGTETITGLNAVGRYLRIYSKARKTQWGVSLWEVEAYGDTNPSCGNVCTPSCSGKQCGSDGCGGSCGTCGAGTTCNASNQCVVTPVSCTDVALTRSAAVASSSENAGTAASKAIDGNTGTRWSSAFTDPQWLYVDLGASRFVKRVILRWEAASSADYDIQVSPDGTNWTTKFTGRATGASVDTITSGLGVQARYIRMYSRRRNTGYGNSLWEMEVYGDNNPACTP